MVRDTTNLPLVISPFTCNIEKKHTCAAGGGSAGNSINRTARLPSPGEGSHAWCKLIYVQSDGLVVTHVTLWRAQAFWLLFWCFRCAQFLCVLVPLLDMGEGCHGCDDYVLIGACLVGVVALSS